MAEIAGEAARCGECGYENPPDGRFCGGCGASLMVACERCGRENPPGQRFCNGCGAELDGDGGGAPARRETPNLPGHLVERARREAAGMVGERKQVTVLFCDLESSMERSQRLDPDAWHELMDRFFRLIAGCVHRYEGTIDKFTGDGAMAIFGAPIAHEDHAQRACRAALALRDELAGLDAELRGAGRGDFPVRIGLNSGEVVVASVGERGQMEYTAHGHAVGLAQRIETAAEPGRVTISGSTARLLGGRFELAALGSWELKGHDRPVEVFELLRAPSDPAPLATEPGRLSAFAGRDRELGRLLEALEGAEAGDSHVVGVVGEPGAGKSRLLVELSRRAAERGIPRRAAHGLSHGRGVPYLPVLELFRDYFGIGDTDPVEAAREKIESVVRSLAPQLEDELPLLCDFLGVADPSRPAEELSADARQRRIFAAVKRLMHARAEASAALVLFEDLHWFDAASLAFAEELVAMGPGTRTLFIVSFRPEFEPPFAARSDYTQLPLKPLGAEAVGEIVASRAGPDPSLDGLAERLAERTDGNPLFCEEMLMTLVEEGALAGEPGAYRLARELGELRIPDTVQAVLAARIDRLSPAEKPTLQAASAIGRAFGFDLLAIAAEIEEAELDSSLRALVAAELVFERASPGEYVFKHALTADVAYASLLERDRRELHARVARGIERLHPERLDEQAALISDHHERAGDPIAAGRWAARGADWATARDLEEAVRLGRRAGALLAQPQDEEDAELVELRLGALMRAAQGAARRRLSLEEGEAVFEEPRALAERTGNTAMAVTMTMWHGSHYFFGFGDRAERALELYREAHSLARGSGDRDLELVSMVGLVAGYMGTGRAADLQATCERGLDLASGDFDLGAPLLGRSPGVNFLFFRSGSLAMQGRLGEALEAADEAVDRARRRPGEPENIGWALWSRTWAEALAGVEPGADAAESLEVGRRIGNRANEGAALGVLVAAANLRGEHAEAERQAGTALAELDYRIGFVDFDLMLGRVTALAGLGDREAVPLAEEAVRIADAGGMRFNQGRARVALLGALRRTDPARARAEGDVHLERIGELVEMEELGSLRPHAAEQRGELALLEGDEDAARTELERARDLFERSGAAGHAVRLAGRLDRVGAGSA